MQHNQATRDWPVEYAEQMATLCEDRLLKELRKLNAPDHVFELLFGMGYFSLYAKQPDDHLVANDFTRILQNTVQALVDTGGI